MKTTARLNNGLTAMLRASRNRQSFVIVNDTYPSLGVHQHATHNNKWVEGSSPVPQCSVQT